MCWLGSRQPSQAALDPRMGHTHFCFSHFCAAVHTPVPHLRVLARSVPEYFSLAAVPPAPGENSVAEEPKKSLMVCAAGAAVDMKPTAVGAGVALGRTVAVSTCAPPVLRSAFLLVFLLV